MRAALFSALAMAACSRDLSVHVRGGERPKDPGYRRALVVDGGIDVTRFRIVLRNLRLQSEPTDGGSDTPGTEFIGPGTYLVDLPAASLTGGAFTELISSFTLDPRGFYEMDIDLSPVTADDVRANPALAPLLDQTFMIEGQGADGGPFVFTSGIQRVLTRQSVFRIGFNHNNLDLNVAPGDWFVSDAGVLAPDDPAVHDAIEANVAASIDAYEDDDMDGIPDPLG